VINQTR